MTTPEPIKISPGDDMHLNCLMAPYGLTLVTGTDREHLLAYGRAAFAAGQKAEADRAQRQAEPTGVDPEMGFMLESANAGELAAYDHAVQAAIAAVLNILDGKDAGEGVSHDPWESVRRRLLALVQRLAGQAPVAELLYRLRVAVTMQCCNPGAAGSANVDAATQAVLHAFAAAAPAQAEPLSVPAVSHCINQTLGEPYRQAMHKLARLVEQQCALAWGITLPAPLDSP